MATFKRGILGGFQGKVGTVIGSRWRGVNVMRAVPERVRDARTPKQLAQRERFGLLAKLLKPIRPVVNLGFEVGSGSNYDSGNAFIAYNIKYAIGGEFPGFTINYPQLRIAMGSLEGVFNATVEAAEGSVPAVNVSWTDNTGTANARSTDQVLLLAYNEELNRATFQLGEKSREDGAATLILPGDLAGKPVQLWLACYDEARGISSNSAYLGSVVAG